MVQRRPILVVQTGDPVPSVLSSRGSFADLIVQTIGSAWPGSYDSFDARTDPAPSPRSASALIITGSASSVADREGWVLRIEEWLRDAVAAGVPTLGICFGHQLLGQALGGEVRRNPRGREIGAIRVERHGDDPLVSGLPSSFIANATHVDTVAVAPPGSVPLGRSSHDDHHILRFAPCAYGVQFHPELDADVMRQYLAARADVLLSEGLDPEALSAAIPAENLGATLLTRFVERIVLGSPVAAAYSP